MANTATSIYSSVNSAYVQSSETFTFTGDFTVEFWFYPTSLVSNYVMFDSRHPTTGWPNSSNGFALIGNSSGTIHVYTGGSNFISADYAIQNQANQWHHISVSRQDSFTSLFINGEQKGSIVEIKLIGNPLKYFIPILIVFKSKDQEYIPLLKFKFCNKNDLNSLSLM